MAERSRSRKRGVKRRAAPRGDRNAERGGNHKAEREVDRRHERDADADRARHEQAPGPRSFWSGTITFGLVSVPVDLFPAVRPQRVPLRMLGAEGQPLQRRYVCSADNKPLAYEDIVRGYEWPDGSFTVVSDEELDALAPRKSRDIDLRRFVARDEIPPELLERSYLLAPAGDSTKAYHLLAAAMERGGRAGIATFVMRGKEYLAAIFAEGGLLRAVTMRFADELRSPDDVGLPHPPRVAADTRKRIAAALDKLEADEVDRDALDDDYTAALLELAEKKRAAGRDVVEIAEEPGEDETGSGDVIDIMSVLKQRMGTSRGPAQAWPARAPSAEAAGSPGAARAARAPGAAERARGTAGNGAGAASSADTAGAGKLEASSKKELYERAQELDVPNRSKMSKDELIAAIRAAS